MTHLWQKALIVSLCGVGAFYLYRLYQWGWSWQAMHQYAYGSVGGVGTFFPAAPVKDAKGTYHNGVDAPVVTTAKTTPTATGTGSSFSTLTPSTAVQKIFTAGF